MSETVIKVENLYKEYKLGTINNGTLYRDMQSWWAKLRGKEDPNSVISHDHNIDVDTGNLLALNDISFEVKRGEVLGIIGRNGAGKSTLLKILSRITAPTSGQIKIKGRIGSLLEVGTGFHPELTGRENIYMNGTILGMRKHEITAKLDEIIAFAEIEKFIDTPVKRYSSGMYVRLAFAVAAHLDPEILVVDEVLAVGDANFQKKCLGKMGEVAKEGRTVLFVSHNMGAVRSLCTRGILVYKGGKIFDGKIDDAIETYYKLSNTNVKNHYNYMDDCECTGKLEIENVEICSLGIDNIIREGESFEIIIRYSLKNLKLLQLKDVGFAIHNLYGHLVTRLSSFSVGNDILLNKSKGYLKCIIPKNLLVRGYYFSNIRFESNSEVEYWKQNAFTFEVEPGNFTKKIIPVYYNDIFFLPHKWSND